MTLYTGEKGTLLYVDITGRSEAPYCYMAHTGIMYETEFVFRYSDWTKL